MRHRLLVAAVGWLAASVAATLTGLGAVQIIGDGITTSADGQVLTPEQAERQLASVTAPPSDEPGTRPPVATATPTPSATASPSGSARPASKVITTPGGTVVARCTAGKVTLTSVAPAQGYGVERADRGPDEHAEVTFEADEGEVEIRVRCATGEPTASWKQDDD